MGSNLLKRWKVIKEGRRDRKKRKSLMGEKKEDKGKVD